MPESRRTRDSAPASADASRGGRAPGTAVAAVVTTVSSCLRYRVTGLAAEGAFFAVLSVPPLVFALAGAIGYVSEQFSAAQSTTSARPSSTCRRRSSPTGPSTT